MLPIVLAKFPYSDKGDSKLRPCLVLAVTDFETYSVSTLAYISSKKPNESKPSDFELLTTKFSGLKKNSFLRLHKLFSIDTVEIQSEIGFITDDNETKIKQKLKVFFEL